MGPDFWREMPPLFAELVGSREARQGMKNSCGLDLPAMMGELAPLLGGDSQAAARTRLLDLIGQMQLGCDRVATCRKPVVAVVAGRCIGGGLDRVSACDVRLCSADARFSRRRRRAGGRCQWVMRSGRCGIWIRQLVEASEARSSWRRWRSL